MFLFPPFVLYIFLLMVSEASWYFCIRYSCRHALTHMTYTVFKLFSISCNRIGIGWLFCSRSSASLILSPSNFYYSYFRTCVCMCVNVGICAGPTKKYECVHIKVVFIMLSRAPDCAICLPFSAASNGFSSLMWRCGINPFSTWHACNIVHIDGNHGTIGDTSTL